MLSSAQPRRSAIAVGLASGVRRCPGRSREWPTGEPPGCRNHDLKYASELGGAMGIRTPDLLHAIRLRPEAGWVWKGAMGDFACGDAGSRGLEGSCSAQGMADR